MQCGGGGGAREGVARTSDMITEIHGLKDTLHVDVILSHNVHINKPRQDVNLASGFIL